MLAKHHIRNNISICKVLSGCFQSTKPHIDPDVSDKSKHENTDSNELSIKNQTSPNARNMKRVL